MDSFTPEEVICALCGSGNSTLLFADTVLSPAGEKGIVACTECGLVYRNIRKNAAVIQEYYEQDYHRQSKDWEEEKKNHYKPYMEVLSAFRKHNRILDMGAGQGFFLALCKDKGWNCYGIEPSAECGRFAEEQFGIHLSQNVLDDGQFGEDFFDVVTFWNVLEVIPDPVKTMSVVNRILRPGGAVLIRCVNASFHVAARKATAAAAKILPVFGKMNLTVFHPNNFNKRTLVRLLSTTKFENIRISPAKLAWTTTYDSSSTIFRKSASRAVSGLSGTVYALTGGTFLAPSLLTVAVKPSKQSTTPPSAPF